METAADCPVTAGEGRQWLHSFAETPRLEVLLKEGKHQYPDEVMLQAKELWFRYEKEGKDIVRGRALTVRKGKLGAWRGGNGTENPIF